MIILKRIKRSNTIVKCEYKMVAPDGADNDTILQVTHLFASLFFAQWTDRVIVGWGGACGGGVGACGGGGAAVLGRHGGSQVS